MKPATIVTGAAGGIGADTARVLAERGHGVLLADHNAEALQRTTDALSAQGHDVTAAVLDVTDEASVAEVVSTARGRWGSLTGLVNCAAAMISQPLIQTSLEDWTRVMTVNATGTFLTCKHVITAFLDQGTGGAIVNTSSISGHVGLANQPAYCASKGAVAQFTKQIAVDYAPHQIRCNVVSPGSVETDQLRNYVGSQPDPVATERELIANHPLGRIATTSELSGAIAFLISDEASFITGADLLVDGGFTAV